MEGIWPWVDGEYEDIALLTIEQVQDKYRKMSRLKTKSKLTVSPPVTSFKLHLDSIKRDCTSTANRNQDGGDYGATSIDDTDEVMKVHV